MENAPPPKLTDELLRFEINEGLKQSQIAVKYGVSAAAVSQRVKRLNLTTTAVTVMAPTESRQHVQQQLDLEQQLAKSLDRLNLLLDANDAWLRDANDPTRYDIGPRSEEVMVTYWDEDGEDDEGIPKLVKKKAPLSTLLKRLEEGGIVSTWSETKTADPRENILATSREIRQTVSTCLELARLLVDIRAMQTLKDAIMSEIEKESPACAERILQAVRRILVLHAISG